jgi:chemotaxis protein MotB
MAEKAPEVKVKFVKKKGGHGGAHGGAWKIAYADLVTAMMAFFLLMWLLGSVPKETLEGIAGFMKEGQDFFESDRGKLILENFGKGILPGHRGLDSRDAGEKKETEDPEEVEQRILESVKAAIERAFDTDQLLAAFKDQISLDFTEEGLRIQIKDKEDQALFDSGSDQLKPYALSILREISKELAKLKNHVTVGGHTDAVPFSRAGFSNWDLSSSRANSALRAMTSVGLPQSQVKRVTGYADTIPFEGTNPRDPQNRRISIVVMSSSYEAKMDAAHTTRRPGARNNPPAGSNPTN